MIAFGYIHINIMVMVFIATNLAVKLIGDKLGLKVFNVGDYNLLGVSVDQNDRKS